MALWDSIAGTPTLPSIGRGAAFSPDEAYLAVAHVGSPYLTVIDTSDWSVVAGTPTLAADGQAAAFSPDGEYLAVGHAGSPNITVIDTSDWSVVAGTPTLPNRARAVAFSPDGAYLAAAHDASPYLTVIDTSDWSVVAGTPTMPGNGWGVDFSHDNAYVAVAHFSSPYLTVVDTSDWSVVAGTPTVPEVSFSGGYLRFSHTGGLLAVATGDSPYITVIDTSDWSVVAGTPTLSGSGRGVDFSHTDMYLGVAHNSGDQFTALDTSDWSVVAGTPALGSRGNNIEFSPVGSYVAIVHDGTPYLTVLEGPGDPSYLIATLGDTTADFQGHVSPAGNIEATLDDTTAVFIGQFGTGDLIATLDDTTAAFAGNHFANVGDIVVTLDDTGALFVTSHEPNSRVVTLDVGAATTLEGTLSSLPVLEGDALLDSETFYNPQAEATLEATVEATVIALRHYLRDELLEADAELTVQATSLASLWLRASAEGVTQTFIQRTEEALLEAMVDIVGKTAFAESMQLVAEVDDVTQQVMITEILDQVSAELVPEATLTVFVEEELKAEAGDSVEVLATLMQNITEHVGVWATFKLSDEVVAGWVMNVEGAQPFSEYDNFGFNSFAKIGDTYFAAKDEGIYSLGADTDEGEQIDAHVTSMMLDFGTPRQKRVVAAYLGYTAEGVVVLKVRSVEDGKLVEHWYEANEEVAEAPRDGYAPLGRGMKSRYWQFTLSNKDGADFEISSLELLPIILQRRV